MQGSANASAILSRVERCILDAMNERLGRAFTNDEVVVALNSMSPLKAAREDGLGVVFYQRFWHNVGNNV